MSTIYVQTSNEVLPLVPAKFPARLWRRSSLSELETENPLTVWLLFFSLWTSCDELGPCPDLFIYLFILESQPPSTITMQAAKVSRSIKSLNTKFQLPHAWFTTTSVRKFTKLSLFSSYKIIYLYLYLPTYLPGCVTYYKRNYIFKLFCMFSLLSANKIKLQLKWQRQGWCSIVHCEGLCRTLDMDWATFHNACLISWVFFFFFNVF